MNHSDLTSTDAAEIVLKERERQKETEKRKKVQQAKSSDSSSTKGPKLETVSTPKWEGADQGDIDENELDRRQRVIAEELEKKHREIQKQDKRLAKVRSELKALEEPIKAEIMQLRESLEQMNRTEIGLVESVNSLRKNLHQQEKQLDKVRTEKQDMVDNLIKVMADYEKRKTERLSEIAEIVGGDFAKSFSKNPSSSFSGF